MNGGIRLASLVDCPIEKREGDQQRYVALEHVEPLTGRLLPNAELEHRDPSGAVRFLEGDVLFGKLRPYLRKVIHATQIGCCSGEFLVLRSQKGLDRRFLYYLVLSTPFGDWVSATSYGTKMPRTSWENIRAFRFDLPGVGEQVEIADFLDRETARIDELVDKKKRLIELLEDRRSATISRAVTTGLDHSAPMRDSGFNWIGDIPAHWEVTPLMRLVPDHRPILYGIVLPGPNVDEGVPIIKSGDVKPGCLQPDLLHRTTRYVRSSRQGKLPP